MFTASFVIAMHNYDSSVSHQSLQVDANHVYITVEDGMSARTIAINNVITNIGENQTSYAHGGTSLNCSWVSIGNATEGVALTQLTTEYDRVEVDSINYGAYDTDRCRNVTMTFNFVESVTLNCAGLHWADAGDNNLWAVANFEETAFANLWNMTLTWCQVFDGN